MQLSSPPPVVDRSARTLAWCLAAAVLLGAFLVFQVQPLLSKCILPWFGGTPAVWTTCMLFFQVLLCGGYAYAHASNRWLKPRTQGIVHLGLLALALILLPVAPDASWKPVDGADPTWRILGLLTTCVGMPYLLLSATGPLVQAWFARTQPGKSPYRLYALSNFGSLAALVSYPFLFEPLLAARDQSRLWSLAFAGFGLCCGYCAWRVWLLRDERNTLHEIDASPVVDSPAPARGLYLRWLALACLPSVMLLAVTNHICQDVAVMPFLWVLPLGLYLTTFIICFEKERWYARRGCALALAVSLVALSATMLTDRPVHLLLELGLNLVALFFICLCCHGELVRSKPASRYLTAFYLTTSAGGALGGVLVAIVAPLAFTGMWEFKLGLVASYVLAMVILARCPSPAWFADRPWPRRLAWIAALGGLFIALRGHESFSLGEVVAASRNFYGVLAVDDLHVDDPAQHARAFRHGRILHGLQFTAPDRRREPTTYFAPDSGIGTTLRSHPRAGSLRVGMIGMGVGTVAAYGLAGEHYRFYEINPDVVSVAREHFSFLADCPAKVDVILGDGRLSMEREPPQEYDVLILDAFSGDAVPAHLLTQEAMEVYLRHLRPDGVLVLHISNRHLDLNPVVRALAEANGFVCGNIQSKTDERQCTAASTQVVLARDPAFLEIPAIAAAIAKSPQPDRAAKTVLWRDDFSNLMQVLK